MKEASSPRGMQEALEDFAVSPVPADKRKGLYELTMVYLGCALSVTAWLVGPLLSSGMTVGKGLTVIFIANMLLAVYATLMSEIGRKHGLSTAVVSKVAFGEKGQALTTTITNRSSWLRRRVHVFVR